MAAHIANVVWPSYGPDNALGPGIAKNDGSLLVQMWFARNGPCIGRHNINKPQPDQLWHEILKTASSLPDLAHIGWHTSCPASIQPTVPA